MRRAEVVATVVLPLVLGTLFILPRPGSDEGTGSEAKLQRLYVWSCGGFDGHETPARVVRLPVAEPPNAE